jgi:serine/threonine protein kinase
VRRAYHRQQQKDFALKEINVSSSSPRHQMIKELSAHAECGDMRNIVRLYDVFYDEGLVYLVLELISWGSVRVPTSFGMPYDLVESQRTRVSIDGLGWVQGSGFRIHARFIAQGSKV